MFKINNRNTSEPYLKFYEYCIKAQKCNQKFIDAVVISSLNKTNNEVEARYVNLKYINNDKWIFFTNYNSPKAQNFLSHNQISVLFFWSEINIQVRIKATIEKTDKNTSDEHFKNRNRKKNLLAISSDQSKKINSYENVKKLYENESKLNKKKLQRPDYWGGFSFTPYYFEFWRGEDNRINKRKVYELIDNKWEQYFLQP